VLRNVSVEYVTRLGNRALELIYSLTKNLSGESISWRSNKIERLHNGQIQLAGEGAQLVQQAVLFAAGQRHFARTARASARADVD
jgi:hypothetical protein